MHDDDIVYDDIDFAGNDDICAVLDQLIAAGDTGPAPAGFAAHALLHDFRHDHAHHVARLARLRDELAA